MNSEVWTCARCAREIRVPDDAGYGEWELVEDSTLDDPEDWPVICPGCQTTEDLIAWVESDVERDAE